VVVEDVDEGEVATFEIVFPEEVDPGRGQISLSSPLGQALMNKRVGDEAIVQTPRGRRTYQVMELVTFHERPGRQE
jgi:transcription elongation factor GreA